MIREKEREERHPPFPLLPRQRLFDSFSSFAFIRRPTATRPQGTKEKNESRQYFARFALSKLNMQELPYVSKSCQEVTTFWSNLSGMLAQTVDSPLASLFAWSSGKGIPSPSPSPPFSCREDDAKEEKGADKVASSSLLSSPPPPPTLLDFLLLSPHPPKKGRFSFLPVTGKKQKE